MDELLEKEKEIMNVFWSLNKPCLISDILNADTSLNRNTVAKALVSLDYVNHTRLLNSIRINTSMPQTSLAFFSTLLETGKVDDSFISELESMIQDYKNRKE